MKAPDDLIAPGHSTPAEPARWPHRRWAGLVLVLAWTGFVIVALWWLLRGNTGASVWLVHTGAVHSPAKEPVHALLKADVSFQRLYPWILFGPYVVLGVLCFPLERGRLGLSLPLNLAICLAFIGASTAIEARTRITFANVTFVRGVSKPAGPGTEQFEVRFSTTGSGSDLGTPPALGFVAPPTNAWRKIPGGELKADAPADLTNLVAQLRRGLSPPPPGLLGLSLWAALLNLVAYTALAGGAHAVHFYRRFREREHRALALESNLAQARLKALRTQLQPHFLFNSLNAVVALLRRDPRLAEATLMALSDLLRLALSHSEQQEVPLRDELQFIQRYLDIQQIRFGEKLRVEQEIEPSALDCLVPTLLLQPVVENAIRHGIEPSDVGGLVRLAARRSDGKLLLTVEDNGLGLDRAAADSRGPGFSNGERLMPPASRGRTGIGLSNLRERLEALYGQAQRLELTARSQGGVSVRIELPWHASESANREES